MPYAQEIGLHTLYNGNRKIEKTMVRRAIVKTETAPVKRSNNQTDKGNGKTELVTIRHSGLQ